MPEGNYSKCKTCKKNKKGYTFLKFNPKYIIMEILSSYDKARFEKIESNKDLVTLDYLEDLGDKYTNFIYKFFFNGDTTDPKLQAKAKEKLEILNHTIALPYKIATIKAKFCGKPMTNLDIEEIPEHIINFVYGGYTVFAIDELDDEGKPIINQYAPEQYVKGYNEDKLLFPLQDEDGIDYLLVKTFPKGEGVIYNNLYKVQQIATGGYNGAKVKLDTLKSTQHLLEEEIYETEKQLIYTIHDFKLNKSYYGKPQLDYIKPLLKALDFELVNIKDQLLKHLQAKLALQGIDAGKMPKDEDGNILIREAEAIFLEMGANKPEYIQNKNELLTTAVDLLDKYISNIAMTLSIPLELVAQKGQTGTESTESKLLRMGDFVNDIKFIRDKLTSVFSKMFETCKEIDKNYTKGTKEQEFFCTFCAVLPKDSLNLAQELNIAVLGGFLSQRTAVKQYTGFNEEDLEQELAQIETEKAKSITNTELF